MRHVLLKAKQLFLDALFPHMCLVCEGKLDQEKDIYDVCESCMEKIPVKDTFTCPTCGLRMAEGKKVCHKNNSYFLAAASSYGCDEIKKLIWQLKYRKVRGAARPIGDVIMRHIESLNIDLSSYSIIPIPLSQQRERDRGFNQSEEIAKEISSRLAIPINRDALIRARETSPQAETTDRNERMRNVEGAFELTSENIKGTNILLIDDVHTSGSTLQEAVRILKQGGVHHIIALVAAKADR